MVQSPFGFDVGNRPSPKAQGTAGHVRMLTSHEACLALVIAVSFWLMKVATFNELKSQEAQCRMTVARKARRSPQAAAAAQQRASLVGDGAKWRITNLNQVARAIAKWV